MKPIQIAGKANAGINIWPSKYWHPKSCRQSKCWKKLRPKEIDTHGNCRQSKWRNEIWPKNIDTHGNCRQGKWRKWIKTNGNWHPSNNQERNLQVMISFICQYLQIPYLLAMCHHKNYVNFLNDVLVRKPLNQISFLNSWLNYSNE